jgi:hypothetical protein
MSVGIAERLGTYRKAECLGQTLEVHDYSEGAEPVDAYLVCDYNRVIGRDG